MELRQYFAVIWKWLWLILLGTAVATGLSYYTSRSMSPIYQTSTTVMVGQSLQNTNPNTQDLWTSERLAQTYAEMVKRQPILQGAVDALGLDIPYQWLGGQVHVNLIQNTQLMEIKVMDTDPLRAKVIADELARQLILQSPTGPEKQQSQYRQFTESQIEDLQGKIQTTQEEMQQLQEAIDAETSATGLANKQAQMAALQNKLNTYQTNLAQLLNFFQGSATNYVEVIEPATVPTTPISPRTRLNVLLAATVGLILAVGAAFLLEYLDDTIKTPDDISQALDLFTLGAVTRIEGENIEDKLVTADHPRSPISEAYRVLRTNLQFSAVDKPLKTLLVTSANPIEGKSLTVANLGVVMAQAGLSVVIVDTDLRRPVLHRIFRLTKEDGLTNALLLGGNPNPDGYLQATEVENLRVLTSGPLPPNPSELLGSERMSRLIEHLKGQADILLFDSPPCLAVTDAAVLSSQVDGVLLVVDAGACRRGFAVHAVEGLSKVGGNVLGAVLNKLSPRGAGYYYYYYYYSSEGEQGKRHKRKSSRSFLTSLPVLGSVIKRFRAQNTGNGVE
ncbi:MAG: polysaccharide biosynthesis tyrosine autokinase [Anaerolineae bacterium]